MASSAPSVSALVVVGFIGTARSRTFPSASQPWRRVGQQWWGGFRSHAAQVLRSDSVRLPRRTPTDMLTRAEDACTTLDFHKAAELSRMGRDLARQAFDRRSLTTPLPVIVPVARRDHV